MVGLNEKELDIGVEILLFISRHPDCKNKEIVNVIAKEKRICSAPTVQRYIKKFKDIKYLIYNKEDMTYRISPYIKDIRGDIPKQIKLGKFKDLGTIESLKSVAVIESELWQNIFENTQLIHRFKGNLSEKIYFSNPVLNFLSQLIKAFLREALIMNPETWSILNKSEHFNFEFIIDCEWNKDPKIFDKIEELRVLILEDLKKIPLNSTFPFMTRLNEDISKSKEIIKYLKEFRINIDKEPDEYYRMAAGDHHLRERGTDLNL